MAMETMQIRMNQGLTKRLDTLVKTGIYQNRSEAIRDAVRQLILKETNEILMCTLASEEVLAEAWDTPEEDEAWKDL